MTRKDYKEWAKIMRQFESGMLYWNMAPLIPSKATRIARRALKRKLLDMPEREGIMTAIPQKITSRAPTTQEMTATRPPRVYVSPHKPMAEPNTQKCTCGAWMFKTTNSEGIQILRCARTNECGKWRPLT